MNVVIGLLAVVPVVLYALLATLGFSIRKLPEFLAAAEAPEKKYLEAAATPDQAQLLRQQKLVVKRKAILRSLADEYKRH